MIGYLEGKVLDIQNNVVLFNVNGIGFELTCTSSLVSRLEKDLQGSLYSYTQVREDGIFLFGFDNKTEKDLFLKLITVSGVGPKMAINVLSNMELKDLALAISTSDVNKLSGIKGLGKKTAEKIIIELREKIEVGEEEVKTETKVKSPLYEDAVVALMSLGFTKSVSQKAVDFALESNKCNDIESILTVALQSMR